MFALAQPASETGPWLNMYSTSEWLNCNQVFTFIHTAVDRTDLQQLGYWQKYKEEPDIILSTFSTPSTNWSLSERLQHLHKSFSGAEPNTHMNILKWLQCGKLLKASFKFKVNKPWRELRLPGHKFTLRIGHDHLAGDYVARSVIINESKNADNVKPVNFFLQMQHIWTAVRCNYQGSARNHCKSFPQCGNKSPKSCEKWFGAKNVKVKSDWLSLKHQWMLRCKSFYQSTAQWSSASSYKGDAISAFKEEPVAGFPILWGLCHRIFD